MKLYISAPSPFARRCRIVAREKGLADRIQEIIVDPYADDADLMAANPIVQVPTLIAEDGLPITDSPVICAYLDRLGQGAALLPMGDADWLAVRRLEGLGNAALEMGVKLLLELRRPEADRSTFWMDRWRRNMGLALDALEQQVPADGPLDIGVITAAVAATWIGFRHPDYDWASARPRLAALTQRLEARPSFVETAPS